MPICIDALSVGMKPGDSRTRKQRSAFRDCLIAQGEYAVADPLAAIRYRNSEEAFRNTTLSITLGLLVPRASGLVDAAIEHIGSSDKFSSAILAGLRERGRDFKLLAQEDLHDERLAFDDYEYLYGAWLELRSYLQQVESESTVEEERRHASSAIISGDVIIEATRIATIKTKPDSDTVHSSQEQARIFEKGFEAILEEIRDLGKHNRQRVELEHDLERIEDYRFLANGFISIAVRSGVTNPDEAFALSNLTNAISQITQAQVLFEANEEGNLVRPYALYMGGIASVMTALDGPGKSETEAVMKGLQMIARQLESLQFSLDQGLIRISDQLTGVEHRLSSAIHRVLTDTTEIKQAVQEVLSEIHTVQEAIQELQDDQHNEKIQVFMRDLVYQDRLCLKDVRAAQERACLASYDRIIRTFDTSVNAMLTGELAPRPGIFDSFWNSSHRSWRLLKELVPEAEEHQPYHEPVLSLLSQRLSLFFEFNPRVRRMPLAQDLLEKIQSYQAVNEAFLHALQSPGFTRALAGKYDESFTSLVDQLDLQLRRFESDLNVSQSDVVFFREQRLAREPTSLARRSELFPDQVDLIYARYVSPTNTGYLLEFSQAENDHVREKLQNYAAAATQRDGLHSLVFSSEPSGYTWISPCTEHAGFPDIPILRQLVAGWITSDLVRLEQLGHDSVDLCYEPIAQVENLEIAVNNTNEGRDVVNQRLQQVFGGESPDQAYYRFCDPLFLRSHVPNANAFYLRFTPDGYFHHIYARFPEYSLSAWEKCHGGHVHHVLRSVAHRFFGVEVRLKLNVGGYVAPLKTFSATQYVRNELLHKCFLPFNRHGVYDPNGVLMPFLQAYPLPIGEGCRSTDQLIADGLYRLGPEVKAFLAQPTRSMALDSPTITYRDAVQTLVADRIRIHRRETLETLLEVIDTANFPEASASFTLDDYAYLLRHLNSGSNVRPSDYIASDELRLAVSWQLFDEEKKRVRTVTELMDSRTGQSAVARSVGQRYPVSPP